MKDWDSFRLNIFGMGRYREYMELAGMLDNEWAGPEYHEGDQAGWDEAVMTQPREVPDGIPTYKFCSNDGWLVTPEEIRSALAAMEQCDVEELNRRLQDGGDNAYWADWLRFLQRAEKAEGFRVW